MCFKKWNAVHTYPNTQTACVLTRNIHKNKHAQTQTQKAQAMQKQKTEITEHDTNNANTTAVKIVGRHMAWHSGPVYTSSALHLSSCFRAWCSIFLCSAPKTPRPNPSSERCIAFKAHGSIGKTLTCVLFALISLAAPLIPRQCHYFPLAFHILM